MGLQADELAQLRKDTESWFDATCDIFRVVGTDDPYGGRGRSHGANPLYSAVPCAIDPGAGQNQELLTLANITEVELFTVSLPAKTDVLVGDHLRVHKDGEELHLNVRAVMGPESYEVERRVIATEVGTTAPH